MAPTLILIRHGEALHNVSQEYDIPDPELSALGRKQCQALEEQLRKHLPLANGVEAIISSPMIRTLETTLIGLDWLIQRGVPIELEPLWQENSNKPCDTGSEAARLEKLFPNINFSDLDSTWPAKGVDTPYAFTKRAVLARGQSCLKKLYHRPEKVVAVVSHSGFLRCAVSHTRYANADYRIFDYAPNSTPDEPQLVEWSLTADNGGGMGTSEKGRAEITATDFPAEKTEEIAQKFGEQTEGEAVKEVPQ